MRWTTRNAANNGQWPRVCRQIRPLGARARFFHPLARLVRRSGDRRQAGGGPLGAPTPNEAPPTPSKGAHPPNSHQREPSLATGQPATLFLPVPPPGLPQRSRPRLRFGASPASRGPSSPMRRGENNDDAPEHQRKKVCPRILTAPGVLRARLRSASLSAQAAGRHCGQRAFSGDARTDRRQTHHRTARRALTAKALAQGSSAYESKLIPTDTQTRRGRSKAPEPGMPPRGHLRREREAGADRRRGGERREGREAEQTAREGGGSDGTPGRASDLPKREHGTIRSPADGDQTIFPLFGNPQSRQARRAGRRPDTCSPGQVLRFCLARAT